MIFLSLLFGVKATFKVAGIVNQEIFLDWELFSLVRYEYVHFRVRKLPKKLSVWGSTVLGVAEVSYFRYSSEVSFVAAALGAIVIVTRVKQIGCLFGVEMWSLVLQTLCFTKQIEVICSWTSGEAINGTYDGGWATDCEVCERLKRWDWRINAWTDW